MGIGVGIFLAAVGAILAFAVDDTVKNVDLVAIGYILMAAGVIGVLLDLLLFGPRRRADVAVVEDRRIYEEPRVARRVDPAVVEERRIYEDPQGPRP